MFMYVDVLPTYMSVRDFQGTQKRALDVLELELQMMLSHHVGVWH